MSRVSKVLMLLFLVVFVLACNFVTRPIDQAQEAVQTVQSLATAIPMETIQAFPSAMSEIELPTGIPDFGNAADPKDPPLTEWNGIPVMPAAIAGAESSGMYSFKVDATVTDVIDYYKTKMTNLGWTELFITPDAGNVTVMTYDKENQIVLITITSADEGISQVFLTYQ